MMQSNDSDEQPTNLSATKKQTCFSSVQQRRFWQPIRSTIRLCPSMDLIAYELIQQQQTISSMLLNIHRTLNWQKIASVVSSPEPASNGEKKVQSQNSTRDTSSTENSIVELRTIEWRPDGRFIAVAVDSTVHIYSVESLLMESSLSGAGTDTLHSSSGNDIDSVDTDTVGKVHTVTIESADDTLTVQQSHVASLSWVHVGTWSEHILWPSNTNNHNAFLRQQYYHKGYADRWTYILPPSEYHFQNNAMNDNNTGWHDAKQYQQIQSSDNSSFLNNAATGCFPSEGTPLSMLCVSTLSGHLHLYLHGRYRIAANIPLFPPSLPSTSFLPIVASPDLTHFITASAADDVHLASLASVSMASTPLNVSTVIIMSFSSLAKHRFHFQSISILYCKIVHRIDCIRKSIPEIYASWKASLKPIDLKLDGLQKLLQSYGLVPIPAEEDSDEGDDSTKGVSSRRRSTVRSLLVQYVLSGHTRTAPTLSNAVDQFFTGVQMNDQLLQRMGQSLAGAIANIESVVRKQLVAPATALVYEIDQLYGISAYRSDVLSTEATLQLLHDAQQLYLVVGATLTVLIDARSRIRDFVAWLRCTGAIIKARGTAMNSVQRENAKKRRVSESVIRKLLSYLQDHESDAEVRRVIVNGGITETLLHLRFAEMLRETPQGFPNLDGQQYLCAPLALEKTSENADKVFEYPRACFAQSMQRTNIQLFGRDSQTSRNSCYCLAIATRLGKGGIDSDQFSYGDDHPGSFFAPNISGIVSDRNSTQDVSTNVRQWLVTAETIQSNSFRLRAFPLTWTNTADDDFDDDADENDGLASEFEYVVNLTLPTEYFIRDIVFFGDDGKSSLSSVLDAGSASGGKEGRHRLGLLVSTLNSVVNDSPEEGTSSPLESSAKTASVELWIIPYDDLEYLCQSIEVVTPSGAINQNCKVFGCRDDLRRSVEHLSPIDNLRNYLVLPMFASSSIDCNNLQNNSEKVLYARTRQVFASMDFSGDDRDHSGSRSCRLVLSGSRGIGAVYGIQQGSTVLQILELEEDEEEDNDEEGEPDGMEDDAP
jgi:Anaphase-promoting complex, cyclosome, subunit 4/Anaphase-promoting complex subunit 4 WD40 domain